MKKNSLPICAAVLLSASFAVSPVLFAADPPPTTPAPTTPPPATPAPPPGGGTGGAGGAGGAPGRPGGPGGPGGRGERIERTVFQGRGPTAGSLGFDEKQRELYREASMKDSDELRKLEEKMRAAQKELLHTVIAEKYDEKAVREKADVISKLNVEITMLRSKALATVAPTLKPEQREQLENSPMGTALLSGGGFGGGYRGGGTGGPGGFGGPGGPGGAGGGGYRGGDGQPQPGGEQLNDGGRRGSGDRRKPPQ